MADFVYYVGSSVDGFIAQEGGRLAWLDKFDNVEGLGESYRSFEEGVGCVVMGGETYQWIREHHPGEWSYRVPCWVFSHHELSADDGADVVIVRGDVAEFADELRRAAGGRDVYIVGGGDLAGQFLAAGLLDRIVVTFVPEVLGGGVPLFGAHSLPEARSFRLVGLVQRDGTVELDYRRAEA